MTESTWNMGIMLCKDVLWIQTTKNEENNIELSVRVDANKTYLLSYFQQLIVSLFLIHPISFTTTLQVYLNNC